MKYAVIAVTDSAKITAEYIAKKLPDSHLYFQKEKGWLKSNTNRLFHEYKGLIFIMATGIVVRIIAPYLESKYSDPAVVVVDDACRYSISLLSGHEGGANDLTAKVATLLNAQAVITTASDTNRNIIIGVGCRRNTTANEIEDAVENCLKENNLKWNNICTAATIDLKKDETGLLEVFNNQGIPVKFFSTSEINSFDGPFDISNTAVKKLGVKAVAEPCALMAGYKTELIQSKKIIGNVTVALAMEQLRSELLSVNKMNTTNGRKI